MLFRSHVSELHTGVDWGAPYGTPIFSAGNGDIEEAGLKGGYGKYVPVDIRNIDTAAADSGEEQSSDDDGGVRLYQSLYETALRNNVPGPVISEFVRVFSYDVDFERKVTPGDSFDVLYSDDESGEGHNELRYASLTVDRKSTRLNSSHEIPSRMPSSA